MADLDERGQIILIAAFAMAVTFVSLALIVNSAIYTENLASRGETSGSDDALVVRHEVEQSVGESITYANTYNTSSHATLEANVTNSVATISDSISKQQAATGKIVTIEGPTAFDHGTRIRDNASTGGSNFTGSSSDAQDWVLGSSVEQTRAFRLNVSSVSSSFEINLKESSGSENWRVVVTESSNNFTVTVHESGTTIGSCEANGPRTYVIVDLTDGLVDGEPCPHLQFNRGVSSPYDIWYNNSRDVTGNYSLVVDEDLSPASPPANLSGSRTDDDPYITDALYAANVTYRYDGPALIYNTTVRVAPGEPR